MTLQIHKNLYAVVRLPSQAEEPPWLHKVPFYSSTRTKDELSIVCPQACVPGTQDCQEREWRLLQVKGTLDFSLTGILASIAVPLAHNAISIFALSTFDTDYILVKNDQLTKAQKALVKAGFALEFEVEDNSPGPLP